MPTEYFNLRLNNRVINDSIIEELAHFFHVSREVILRKVFDKGLITKTHYDERVGALAHQSTGKSNNSSQGNYYLTQGTYLGGKYIEKAFSQYYQQQITPEKLADYLGVKVKNLTGMESLLYKSGATV